MIRSVRALRSGKGRCIVATCPGATVLPGSPQWEQQRARLGSPFEGPGQAEDEKRRGRAEVREASGSMQREGECPTGGEERSPTRGKL
jgi:hypothetical protein